MKFLCAVDVAARPAAKRGHAPPAERSEALTEYRNYSRRRRPSVCPSVVLRRVMCDSVRQVMCVGYGTVDLVACCRIIYTVLWDHEMCRTRQLPRWC